MSTLNDDLFSLTMLFIQKHGVDKALQIARKEEQRMAHKGDLIEQAAWRAIYSAIVELQKAGQQLQ
jgi:hypothetical protein